MKPSPGSAALITKIIPHLFDPFILFIHQVTGIENEAKFIIAMQEERSAVALAVFLFNDTSGAEEKVRGEAPFGSESQTILFLYVG